MFYFIAQHFGHDWLLFNLFRYITFRSLGAVLTALSISLWLGPRVIAWLKKHQGAGQPIRDDGPQSHLLTKKGTPTMGGVLILLALGLTTLLWADLSKGYVWCVMAVTFGFGLIGGMDDYLKLSKRNPKGLSGKSKLAGQTILTLIVVGFITQMLPEPIRYALMVPFFKKLAIPLGVFFFPFAWCVIVGASNAVNLTDGLDGLAIGPSIIVAGCFALITYVVGNYHFASYLQLPMVPGAGELAVLCGALIGAGLGFLWFNAPPAMVFMGDTGSLAIGGFLGTIALITKHEMVLFIAGGLFVIEAISVIVQVSYFKWTGGQRIFLMAPIHHHFEQKGWSETRVVFRFWIMAIVFGLLGLATLKLR